MERAPAPSRLLLAEDDEDVAEEIMMTLKDAGIDVRWEKNGAGALAALKAGGFTAMISDLRMPKLTGIELLAELRVLGLEIPVVIMTGFGDIGAAAAALRLGAIDFLEKPLDMETLVAVAYRVLEIGARRARLAKLIAGVIDTASQGVAERYEEERRALDQLRLSSYKQDPKV